MTQRTINLYDGLEALYYFDSDYFDSGTNEIKDKSGYGRHATAQGGPTVGVNGPNDFEATSFDGNDDRFVTPSKFDSEPFTWVVIVKSDGSGGGVIGNLANFNGGMSIGYRTANDMWVARDGNNRSNIVDHKADKWYMLGFRRFADGTGTQTFAYDESGLLNIDNNSLDLAGGFLYNFQIGNGDVEGQFGGEIALVGVWYRILSDAEIQALNDLTAPRRAQL